MAGSLIESVPKISQILPSPQRQTPNKTLKNYCHIILVQGSKRIREDQKLSLCKRAWFAVAEHTHLNCWTLLLGRYEARQCQAAGLRIVLTYRPLRVSNCAGKALISDYQVS